MRKRVYILIAGIACLILLHYLIVFVFGGEEARLKRTINALKRLSQAEKILGLSNHISNEYTDEYGNDKRSLLWIAQDFFENNRGISISLDSLDITLGEDTASVTIKSTVFWQENSSEQISYDTLNIRAGFKDIDKRWKLIRIEALDSEKKVLFSPRMAKLFMPGAAPDIKQISI